VKPGKRSFYRTEVKITVLTESPYEPASLDQLAYDKAHGECSMGVTVGKSEEIDGPTMARLCLKQFSDPALFDLTDLGEDLDDAQEMEEKGQGEPVLPPEYRVRRLQQPR
jgi:hypothetical protein